MRRHYNVILPREGVVFILHAVQYIAQTIAVGYSTDLSVRRSKQIGRTHSWILFSTVGITVIWCIRSIHWGFHFFAHPRGFQIQKVRAALAFEALHFAWASLWVLHLLLDTSVDPARIIVLGESYVLLSLYIAQVALSAAILGRWDEDNRRSIHPIGPSAPTGRLQTSIVHSVSRGSLNFNLT